MVRCIQHSLFWRKLTSKLQEWGFEMNPYNPCVANKLMGGMQCTITSHIDNLKISHVNPKAVEAVLGLLSKEFGREAPLTMCQEKAHNYLGMRIDYSNPGKVLITMLDYVDGMLTTLPMDMSGVAASTAASHLFEVNPTAAALDKTKAELFHHYTAKLLFLCKRKRARPDIQTAVAFLMTRVKGPNDDNYKKLQRVMRYLRATKDMPLTLEADHMHIEVVGRHFICRPSRYERPHWQPPEFGKICGLWDVAWPQDCNSKLDGSGAREPLRCPSKDLMDPQLSGCAGLRCQGLSCPSGQ
jgi:hypothetical protein